MAVPKKRTSKSKKKIRNNIWKGKAYRAAAKAFSLVNGDLKHFFELSFSRSAKGFSFTAEDSSSGSSK
uniref:Large ribosomal subunit protein bL32c n=1 Tax=Torreya fargesii var. yunnanensis TaxID=147460 RepID=A0A8E4WWR1_9CONI|nr:ribosomal protein L32 [Torreya fargesii var. yunnanensis]QPO90382.1 ribosomal protein L32 [Torreya fargesii var. yunnanensis]